jgi:hypothetical protein
MLFGIQVVVPCAVHPRARREPIVHSSHPASGAALNRLTGRDKPPPARCRRTAQRGWSGPVPATTMGLVRVGHAPVRCARPHSAPGARARFFRSGSNGKQVQILCCPRNGKRAWARREIPARGFPATVRDARMGRRRARFSQARRPARSDGGNAAGKRRDRCRSGIPAPFPCAFMHAAGVRGERPCYSEGRLRQGWRWRPGARQRRSFR